MKSMLTVFIFATATAAAGSNVFAQEWQPKATSGTNDSGYRYSGFYVEPSGSGCRGGQNYVDLSNPKNKGFSATRFTTATKADGGVVCSGGTWYHGPGDKKGQAGGSMRDILIKNGKFFIR